MHDTPNIIGGSRVAWSAAIVCGCILGVVPIAVWALVGAGFLLKG